MNPDSNPNTVNSVPSSKVLVAVFYLKIMISWMAQHRTFLVSHSLLAQHCHSTLYLEIFLHIFPYYKELNAIWKGISSFDSKLISSNPDANHAKSLPNIVASNASVFATIPEDKEANTQYNAEEMEKDEKDAPTMQLIDGTTFYDVNMDVELATQWLVRQE